MVIDLVFAYSTAGAFDTAVLTCPSPVIESAIFQFSPSMGAAFTCDIEGRLGPNHEWEKEKTGVDESDQEQIVRVWPEMRVTFSTFSPSLGSLTVGACVPFGSVREGAVVAN
ncbi:MAG: hypothetical protein GY722_02915 [bacterium]|nr:hypothetical protein [bacterium]